MRLLFRKTISFSLFHLSFLHVSKNPTLASYHNQFTLSRIFSLRCASRLFFLSGVGVNSFTLNWWIFLKNPSGKTQFVDFTFHARSVHTFYWVLIWYCMRRNMRLLTCSNILALRASLNLNFFVRLEKTISNNLQFCVLIFCHLEKSS